MKDVKYENMKDAKCERCEIWKYERCEIWKMWKMWNMKIWKIWNVVLHGCHLKGSQYEEYRIRVGWVPSLAPQGGMTTVYCTSQSIKSTTKRSYKKVQIQYWYYKNWTDSKRVKKEKKLFALNETKYDIILRNSVNCLHFKASLRAGPNRPKFHWI